MMPMAKDKKKKKGPAMLGVEVDIVKDAPAAKEVEPAGDDAKYQEFELKDKARTLQEAEEIKADPELMDALQPYLAKKASALEGVKTHIKSMEDLKALAKEKTQPY